VNEEEAFLQTIAENADDDLPRLIFADWLEERGDPRGEFIRVQCALARMPPDDPDRPQVEERERGLLGQYEHVWTDWLARLVDHWEFRRGFVERVVMLPRSFVAHGKELLRAAPVRHIHFFRRNQMHITEIMVLARSPFLTRLETIRLNTDRGIRDEDVRELAASPNLIRLSCLDLSDNWISNLGAAYLADSLFLSELHVLKLARNRIGPPGKRALRERFGERVSF
jgi:uncharacterized protein (TIGR02996 family)